MQLVSFARPVAPSVTNAKSSGFQSTLATPPPDGERGLGASQPPTNLGQPGHARVAWDLYQYAVSAGFELMPPAMEGLWDSQVCEGVTLQGCTRNFCPDCIFAQSCQVQMCTTI